MEMVGRGIDRWLNGDICVAVATELGGARVLDGEARADVATEPARGGIAQDFEWTEVAVIVTCVLIAVRASPSVYLVFVPIGLISILVERVLTWRGQATFRAGWRTDIYHVVLSTGFSSVLSGLVRPT